MKKIAIGMVALLITVLLLSACTPQTNNTNTTTTAPVTTTTTEQVGIGGEDNWDMTRQTLLTFSIEKRVSDLVDKEEYERWRAQFEPWVGTGTRTLYEYNMYTLITEFDIPRDKIEEICRKYKEMYGGFYFTDEQVEAIYNGTEAEVYALFANPYAVMVGREAYSPYWMVEHTAEEYLEVGITYEILKEEFESLLVPCNKEQKEYLNKQLEALEKLK